MTLRLPQEIVTERFLPTIRAMLARALADRGWTQSRIADRLGVTQAAVSKYAHGRVSVDERIREAPATRRTVERIADDLDADRTDDVELLSELLDLVRALEDRGPICDIHEERMPSLAGLGCDLCIRGPDTDVAAERSVLSNVRRAVRRFEALEDVADLVPNVGTNIGMALPDPQGPHDVAAVPGRIYAMQGRIEVPAHPEFGQSRHVADVVLAAHAADPAIRAALNLRTSDRLLDAVDAAEMDAIAFDADPEDRRDRLRETFMDRGAVPDVAYHEGAFGVEPIAYVLAETAVDTVEAVAALLATEL